jgi:myo-inositol-1(or 4)-monophosphatase
MPDLPSDLNLRLRIAEEAARAAGAVHLRYLATNVEFEVKADPRDLLTRADLEGQEAAKVTLRRAFPDERLAGEEDSLEPGEMEHLLEQGCWLIDPLDGTQSYVHDFPFFCAGIAYVQANRALVGAIYDAVHDEMFSAAAGLGASFNGLPARMASEKPLKDAMVGLHIREVTEAAVDEFLSTTGRVLMGSHGIRLLGCPMLSMAYVATGRLDAFAMLSPSKLGPWDLAPAAVVLEEAGGVVGEGLTGRALQFTDRGISGATNRALLEELFRVARAEP